MTIDWSPMTQSEAEEIATWKYPEPYDFYDMTADEEDYEMFIHPKKRSPHTYSARSDGRLIGFLSADLSHYPTVDIGLGMHPEEAGKGEGKDFVESCLAFMRRKYQAKSFTLSVAVFNQRAVTVYDRVGFTKKETFIQATNGGHFEFVSMKKE